MENVSWLQTINQTLGTMLYQYPVLQQAMDLTIKSIVVLTIFALLDATIGRRISSTNRHLLWLNGLLCLAILPFMPAMLSLMQGGAAGNASPAVLFELSVYATQLQAESGVGTGTVLLLTLLLIYLLPVVLLLARLLFAMYGLRRICQHAEPVSEATLLSRVKELRQQLAVSRRVTLSISDRLESPVSFGLFRPEIILPGQADEWNDSTMTDVLLHELCHIKRLDWLTTLLAYVLACAFWINPLVWLALKRIREESENSCDTAVLHAGRSDTDYAESLLGVAVSCIHTRRNRHSGGESNKHTNNPLMQTMLDQHTLKTRISRVLEENKMKASELKKETTRTFAWLFVLSVAMLSMLGTTQVLLAQQQPNPATRTIDEEMIPLHTEIARYPTVAAEEGIEGWVQVRFTVSADGAVPRDSISIVEAQPADVFNASAIAAASRFRFSPRIVGGETVDVPNVQYVFRYRLNDDSEEPAQP